MALERLAVDDERHIRDVRVLSAAVRLVRQLDDGVRAVIEEPLEAGELVLAYCRTRSGTSRFLPLTIVLTGDLPARVCAWLWGGEAQRSAPPGTRV